MITNKQREKILVVDDTPSMIDLLRTTLEDEGYQVFIANNGEKAISRAKLTKPDLVLLDVLMPQMDGFTVCRHFKSDDSIKDIPIIMMTALTATEHKVKAFEVQCVDYITKPIEINEVLGRIRIHLSLQHMRQQLKEKNELLQKEINERILIEEEIIKLNNSLEIKVKEKTADLEKTNALLQTEIEERKRIERDLRDSEELHRVTIQNIFDPVFITDDEGKFTYICSNVSTNLGYAIEEIEKMENIYNLIGYDIFDYDSLVKKGSLNNLESRVSNKAGDERNFLINVKRVSIKDGTILFTLHDITDRKRSEMALFESEKKYRIIADNTADTIWSMDLNFAFTYISPSVYNFRGFTVEEAMSQSLEQMLPPDSLHKIYNLFDEEMRLEVSGEADIGRSRIFETEQYRKDGSIIWVENTVSFLRDKNLKPVGILGISRNITDRKRVEKMQAAIYRISESAQTSPGLDVLFSSIHNIIAELMPARNFYIAWYNSATETIHFPYFSDEFDSPPSTLKLRGGLTDYVLRTGKSLLSTPQVFKQLVQSSQVETLGTEPVDWLGVPLKTQRGAMLGVMAVQTYTEDIRLTANHQNILEFVSAQVTMAIERKKAEEELKERMTRAELIAKMGQSTTAILELGDLLNQSVNLIQKTFEYYNVIIFLQEGKEIVLKATTLKFEQNLVGKARLKIKTQGIVGWVADIGQAVIVPDVRKDNRYYMEHKNIKTLSEIAVPIKLKGETIGVLDAQSTRTDAFSQLDIFTLQTISDQLAIAIENARLYESSQIEIAERKRSENELLEYRLHLEDIIKDRTKELEKVNKLLQEEIEKQKEAEEKVKQALEKEKELSELKSKFISIASHEFRTPLSIIYSSAELLDRYGKTWESKNYDEQIESIKSNVRNLTEIMDDVLTISRDEIGKVKYEPRETNLEELCNSILENIKLLCSDSQQLSYSFLLKRKNYVLDEKLFKYILMNLLSNAVKYSNENSRVGFIVDSDKYNLIIHVSDEGIGIPEEDQPHLFEPFHRCSNVGEIHGTGLGMSIVKRSVDLHGGSIEFTSKPGIGTKFTVIIPIK